MQRIISLLLIAFFMLCSASAFADGALSSARNDVTYLDDDGNPIDYRCVAFDENGPYLDEEKCAELNKPKSKWHEGFMIRSDLGAFAATQALSTGYRSFIASTGGFSGQIDFGYHWQRVGIFATVHFKPGVARESTTIAARDRYYCEYSACDEKITVLAHYDAIKEGDWNRGVGGIGTYVSFYIPFGEANVISFDLGGRFLFGKATDNVHIHTEFNMFVALTYQYLLTDNFGLGFNFKIPGIITAASINAFNNPNDITSKHVTESIFAELNLSMSYTF